MSLEQPSPTALSLIIAGAILSLSRDYIVKFSLWLHSKLFKQQGDERVRKGLQLYLLLTGMMFAVLGLLGIFGVIKF